MLESLASQDFAGYVNQTFTLSTEQESFEAELVEVEERAQPRGGKEREGAVRAFSLTFAAPSDCRAGQQTFAVSHPKFGALKLFMVPHGPLADGRMSYLAVLN